VPRRGETPIIPVFSPIPVLCVENLACTRGERLVFSGVGFTVEAGEVVVVTGANGSGKTSLLRIVCGLLEATEGEVRWDGASAKSLGDDYVAKFAYLGHLNALKEDLSGVENLEIWAGLSGVELGPDDARTALQRLGLAEREDVPVRWLSQGQKRRAALARFALAPRPLWILDEPFAALDRGSSATVESLLQAHLESGGMALLSTHQDLGTVTRPVRRLTLPR
jgi:heme exporter protein A